MEGVPEAGVPGGGIKTTVPTLRMFGFNPGLAACNAGMLTPYRKAIPEKVSPLAIACVRGVGEGEGSGVEVPGRVGVRDGVGVSVRKYSKVGVDSPKLFEPGLEEQAHNNSRNAGNRKIDHFRRVIFKIIAESDT